MPSILTSIAKKFQRVYQKAGDFIEEEREFPVSQVFLNATFKRYVTDNVKILEDLHADLHDDWLRLYATIRLSGMLYTTVSTDLKLVQMEMNRDTQLIVFEQISETQMLEAKYDKFWIKWAVQAALFFYRRILQKDPLGPILQKYNVVEVKDELLLLDLSRWLGDVKAVTDTLNKVHINHAELRETEMVVIGNVNLIAFFNKMNSARFDDDLDGFEDVSDQISPIHQKADLKSS